MPHPQIITAIELNNYANTRASEEVVPQLIRHLVDQADPTLCRIPYGPQVNEPGWDGKVTIDNRFRNYVPAGASYWEITTSAKPETQATKYLRCRATTLLEEERKNATFVFVTPRTALGDGWNEPQQSEWLRRARRDYDWKDVRILDGTQLADWLQEFPALGRWLADEMGKPLGPGSVATPLEYWEKEIPRPHDPALRLPPALYLHNRDVACAALADVFNARTHSLLLLAESEHDVDDFVAAFLQEQPTDLQRYYQNHCLFVRDVESWNTLCELKRRHVLVASPRLDLDTDNQTLQTLATTQNHAIVVPLCGRWRSGDSILRLRSPLQREIAQILETHSFPLPLRKELAQVGGGHIAALRRHLLGLGAHPPYATWENARALAQAGLVGRWSGENLADRSAVSRIVDQTYDGWITALRRNALRSDAPLVQHNDRWRFVARSEAWGALGPELADDDLRRFRDVAISVLGDDDPKYLLPREERLVAAVRGNVPRYSDPLKAGIAESIALFGSRPNFLSSCSQHFAERQAHAIVREALSGVPWTRWASLGSHLTMLAEGAPEAFLDAIEREIELGDKSSFRTLLSQDHEASGVFGTSEIAGILWALEVLAWSPKYLARVAMNLATLAAWDPGSQWTNSPTNSLRSIFLPWMPQTAASDAQKTGALKAVLREEPDVGWKVLLTLLPEGHGTSMGSQQPTWRPWIPADWRKGVTRGAYRQSVVCYFDLAVCAAGTDPCRLRSLIEKLPDLPIELHDRVLSRMVSDEIVELAEKDRFVVREALEDILRLHRRFADADWALPETALLRLEETAREIAIGSPILTSRWLFRQRTVDAYDGQGTFEEQRERLEKKRRKALRGVLNSLGANGVYELASEASSPEDVGHALAHVVGEHEERDVIARFETGLDEAERVMFASFCWHRFRVRGADWIGEAANPKWTKQRTAELLGFLPFGTAVWERAAGMLGKEDEKLYWTSVQFNPYQAEWNVALPVRRFMEYGRNGAAVTCISGTIAHQCFDSGLAVQVLTRLLETDESTDTVNWREVVEIVCQMQAEGGVDEDILFRLEWGFLGLLGVGSQCKPLTLTKRLATDPHLFALVIGLVFGRKEGEARDAEASEGDKRRAENAFSLLEQWNVCPGTDLTGRVDAEAFRKWMNKARGVAEENGNLEIADQYIGKSVVHGLGSGAEQWFPEQVAEVLNGVEYRSVRKGLVFGLIGQRGAFRMTGGREEAQLAECFGQRAAALDAQGFARLASAIREVADYYNAESDRFAVEEENRE